MSEEFKGVAILIVVIVTFISVIIVTIRYIYLKKYSDKSFLDVLAFVIVSLIFSGTGIVGVIDGIGNELNESTILGILCQLPLIISTSVYTILSVRYKKRIAVTINDVKNDEWK